MRIRISVESVTGYCAANYRKGDVFYFERFLIKSDIPVCIHAFSAMQNFLYALAHGVKAEDLGFKEVYIRCPDPGGPFGSGSVMFKLEVIK